MYGPRAARRRRGVRHPQLLRRQRGGADQLLAPRQLEDAAAAAGGLRPRGDCPRRPGRRGDQGEEQLRRGGYQGEG